MHTDKSIGHGPFFFLKLMEPKVRKMAEIVEKASSTYWPALKSIYRDVNEG
jgi:hypothetical protein